MPLISIGMAIKGILLLAKSSAAKAAIVKYGSYMLASKGLVATATTGLAAATAVGYVSTVCSIPNNTKKAFSQLIKGMNDGSVVDFMDGLYKLAQIYNSMDDLLSDFDTLLEESGYEPEAKISFEKTVNEMGNLLQNEIEHKTYLLLKDVEEHLKNRGKSPSEYSERIKTIYIKHTFDMNDDYDELLGRCGKIYSDISSYNQSLSIGNFYTYDHYLAYCIAGWVIDNLNFSCIKGKTQKMLAGDITDNIFVYLRGNGMG